MPATKNEKPASSTGAIDKRVPGFKPNRNSIGVRPRNHVNMTRAEMQADLKKAVENTK